MTTHDPTDGSSSIVRRITVAAIPYGRFATTAVGAGSNAAKSSSSASEKWTVTLENPTNESRKSGLEPPVDLDDVQMRDLRSEPLGQHALTTSDLQNHIAGRQPRKPLDHVQDVAVDQEVLTEACHHPNTSAALASIAASRSS